MWRSERKNWKMHTTSNNIRIIHNRINTKKPPNPCTWKVGITYQPIDAGAFFISQRKLKRGITPGIPHNHRAQALVFRGLGAKPSTSTLQILADLHCLQLCKMWYICPACCYAKVIHLPCLPLICFIESRLWIGRNLGNRRELQKGYHEVKERDGSLAQK